MRVLMVATNRERSPFPVAPLGALVVTAAARKADFEVDVLDLGVVHFPARALRVALQGGRYDVVAFSIRNLDNCSFSRPESYIEQVAELTDVVGRCTEAPIVLGGSGFSVAPAGWFRRTGADYGVVGEGELAFVELLSRLAADESPRGLTGVVVREDASEASAATPCARVKDLDSLPMPSHEDCRYSWYTKRGGFVSVQTKRGCPCHCIYCVYPALEGAGIRLRDPVAIADEVEAVVRAQGEEWFFFSDSVFNLPRSHAMEVCAELSRRGSPARWMAYCNPLGFDREFAEALVASGCVGVELGLDAAVDKMLVQMGKPFDQRQIRCSMEAARQAGLPLAVHLLFGGPTETLADVRETQEFLSSCAPVNAVLASIGIRIHENTPLEKRARQEGLLEEAGDLFEPAFYVSPDLGSDPMAAIDRVVRQRPEWSSPADWAKFSMRATQSLVNRFGSRPQWRNVRKYGEHVRR